MISKIMLMILIVGALKFIQHDEGRIMNYHRGVSLIFLKNKDKCPIIELKEMLEFFDIDNKNNLPVVESQEMKEALNMLVDMNKDRALRAEAFSREIFALDQNSQLHEAEQKGKAEGIQENKKEIAKTLYSLGQTKEFIAKATGLSLEELNKILK